MLPSMKESSTGLAAASRFGAAAAVEGSVTPTNSCRNSRCSRSERSPQAIFGSGAARTSSCQSVGTPRRCGSTRGSAFVDPLRARSATARPTSALPGNDP